MIRDTPSLVDEGRDICLALTVDKEVAFTFDILWYDMLVLNLSEKYIPQIWIAIDHPNSTMFVPNSFLIQNKGKLNQKEESISLSLLPYERCFVRFGLCIVARKREDMILVRCRAVGEESLVYSNEVSSKIIATVGKPCLLKQSLLLPNYIPDSVVISDIRVYFQHQKSKFIPFFNKDRKGELCRNTELLISGVLSYTVKVNYRLENTCYEREIEYISGYTQAVILPEGAKFIKPEVKLILYSVDFIRIERKLYCCAFGMLFFLP